MNDEKVFLAIMAAVYSVMGGFFVWADKKAKKEYEANVKRNKEAAEAINKKRLEDNEKYEKQRIEAEKQRIEDYEKKKIEAEKQRIAVTACI
jgi:F0F1-type ATP synthase membrane subunit b/b'